MVANSLTLSANIRERKSRYQVNFLDEFPSREKNFDGIDFTVCQPHYGNPIGVASLAK